MNDSEDIERIIAAYRRSLTADVMQHQIGGKWGPHWFVVPCSPSAMAHAARQANRSRAARLRHGRRARLRHPNGEDMWVVVLTVLPDQAQSVYALETGKPLHVHKFLVDDALKVLLEGFIPTKQGCEDASARTGGASRL